MIPIILRYSERQQILEEIKLVQREINLLDLQLSSLVFQLVKLSHRYKAHQVNIDRLRSTIAPDKYLPPEIVSSIFISASQHPQHPTTPVVIPPAPSTPTLGFPWTLAQICSRWRRIALSEPTLWSTINFSGEDRHAPMLAEAFSRSGTRPIIRFSGSSRHTDAPDPFLHRAILVHSYRLRSLTLQFSPESFRLFLQLPQGLFDALRSADFTVRDLSRTLTSRTAAVFRGAPHLHSFALCSLAFGARAHPPFASFPLPLDLPWSQLTALYLKDISTHLPVAHDLLRRTPALVECTLCLFSGPLTHLPSSSHPLSPPPYHPSTTSDSNGSSSNSIPLLHLHSLNLSLPLHHPSTTYATFLLPLHLPALTSLSFSLSEPAHSYPAADLTHVLSPMLPGLTHAELTHRGPANIRDVAAPFHPFLTALSTGALSRRTMELMAASPGRMFPRLRRLVGYVSGEDMTAFVGLLRTRWSEAQGKSLQQDGLEGDGYQGIQSAIVYVTGAGEELVQLHRARIRELREQLGACEAEIELVLV